MESASESSESPIKLNNNNYSVKMVQSKYFEKLRKTLDFILQDDAKFCDIEDQSQEVLDDLQVFEMINSILVEFKVCKQKQFEQIQSCISKLEGPKCDVMISDVKVTYENLEEIGENKPELIEAEQKMCKLEQQLEQQLQQLDDKTEATTDVQQQLFDLKKQLEVSTTLTTAAQQNVLVLEQQLEVKTEMMAAVQHKFLQLEQQLEDKRDMTTAAQEKYCELEKQLESKTEMMSTANMYLCEMKMQMEEQNLKVKQLEESHRTDGKSLLILNNAIALRDEQIGKLKCLVELKQGEIITIEDEEMDVEVDVVEKQSPCSDSCKNILYELKLKNLKLELEKEKQEKDNEETDSILKSKDDIIQKLETKLEQQLTMSPVEAASSRHLKTVETIKKIRDKEGKAFVKNLNILNNSLKERDEIIEILQWTNFVMDKKLVKITKSSNQEDQRENKLHSYKKQLAKMKKELNVSASVKNDEISQLKRHMKSKEIVLNSLQKILGQKNDKIKELELMDRDVLPVIVKEIKFAKKH